MITVAFGLAPKAPPRPPPLPPLPRPPPLAPKLGFPPPTNYFIKNLFRIPLPCILKMIF